MNTAILFEQDKANLAEFDKLILQKQATWWEMELPSGKVIFGDTKAEILGYPASKFKTFQDFTNLLHPEDHDAAMQAMRDHLEGQAENYQTMYRIKTSSEEYVTFYDYGQITKREDKNIKLIGFVFKIADPENPEEELSAFKKLVASGDTSLVELFDRAKS